MMLGTGVMLQDRYEILEQIGSGGMSEVYKAKCHKLNRLVGIKVLKSEFTSDAGFVSKFKMEAQAAAGRKFHLCDENFLRDAEKLLSSEFALILGVAPNQVQDYIVSALKIE